MKKNDKSLGNAIVALLVCLLAITTITGGLYHFIRGTKDNDAIIKANFGDNDSSKSDNINEAFRKIRDSREMITLEQ